MDMLKLVGAVFIIFSTTWMGYEYAKTFSERTKQIRQLMYALQTLEAEIMFGLSPLNQASKRIAKQISGPISILFETFSDRLIQGEETASKAWEVSLAGIWRKTSLKQKEYDVLKQFGGTLGLHDRESQQKQIRLTLTHLEAEEKEAGLAQGKYEKMVRSLGLLTGLLLILLLM
jgi:stage III sporulation protein AB